MSATTRRDSEAAAGTVLPGGRYLTTAEAAAVLGMTRRGVLDNIEGGRIVALRPGREWLIPAEEVARHEAGDQTDGDAGWKGQAVTYIAGDGRTLRITRQRARILSCLGEWRGPIEQGRAVEAIRRRRGVELTRARMLGQLDLLVKVGAVARVAMRDRHGAAVDKLFLTSMGENVVDYCRQRGLI